ncbi:MAG TPA: S16 family serine protease [Longilinea sp.]|nr:S16 family serine protease [Longilinea sp.]
MRRLPRLTFGLTWFLVLPGMAWGILGYYLPVLGGTLDRAGTWIVTLASLLLAMVSLVFHLAAHWGVSRLVEEKAPSDLAIFNFGDASQRWPEVTSGGHEALIAGAGPLVNLLLAGLAYLAWLTQTNNLVGLTALFLCGFNGWLFIVNLIPAFPFDGGHIFRASLRGLISPAAAATRLARVLGVAIAAALTGWGAFLFLQRARFSPETGAITLLFVLIILDGLRLKPAVESPELAPVGKRRGSHLAQALGAGLLCLCMLAAASSVLLINNGLDAPGVALSVGPMVQMPDQYRHDFSGQYYLVTVLSQAPITAGEWVLGQVDPAFEIVPPEQVTPKNTTPQQQAKQDYQMLDTSETTAIAVGLKLAGYPTALVGKGVQVDGILPDSHANGILQVGDIITALDGKTVQTTTDLINLVGALNAQTPAHLQIERGQAQLQVDVPLLPPSSPNGNPMIGIQIETAGFDYRPPFPISIETDKISGGPSAGLMFTLTVYNSLTSENLTGGRKIAGTGTINLDGTVGPIGGVKQKVFAAEVVGATYFLCPADNYADAVSVAKNITVIKVSTVDDALAFLRSLPKP